MHLIRVAPDGEATTIAAENAPLPGRDDLVLDLDHMVSINDAGLVGFIANVITPEGESYRAIYVGDGEQTREVVVDGERLPGGDELIGLFPPTLNARGDVLFSGQLRGGPDYLRALILADEQGPRIIARDRDPAPETTAYFHEFRPARLNDRGDMAFISRVHDADTGQFAGEAIFIRPADTDDIFYIAGAKQPAGIVPATGSFRAVHLNARGDLLFHANTYEGGLYLRRADGTMLRVAGRGDRLAGGVLKGVDAELQPHDDRRPKPSAQSALNDFGQVVYTFELDDGRQGVAVFTPPEAR